MRELLLLEDDISLGETLKERLEREDYAISWSRSLAEAKQEFQAKRFNGAIIDIGLPDGDGFEMAREIRLSRPIPILFLTAMNSAEYRLEAYELGAADYIPKPFHLKELLLRLERVFLKSEPPEALVSGDLELLTKSLSIRNANLADKTVQIPLKDFELLNFLIQSGAAVVSREDILKEVWNSTDGSNPRTVDNAIVRLRQTLRQLESTNQIKSIRGAGYQWVQG